MTGIGLVLDHLLELAAVLAMAWVCLALGLPLLDRIGAERVERPLANLVHALLLGLSAYATAILLLGLAGLVRPWSLGLLTLLLGAAASPRFGETANLLRSCSHFARSRWDLAAFALLGLIAAGLLIQSSAPPTDWDALVYHLEAPRAWLADGRIHLPPDNLHAAFTGLIHALFLPLLAIGAPSATATLSAVLACVLGVLLFEFGDRFFDRPTGRIATVALFGSPAVLLVAMTPRIDVTLALFLTASLYALYATLFDKTAGPDTGPAGLYLATLLLGLATGIKLIALPWILLVGPLVLWGVVRRSDGMGESATVLMRCGAAFALGAAPWMLFRWHLVEAPFYPLLSPRHIEPWLQPWFTDTVLGEGAYARFETAPRYTSDLVTLHALLFEPGTLTPEREGAFYFPGPLLWMLPLAFLRPKMGRLWLLVVLGVVFVALIPILLPRGGRANLRFLIPALPVLTLAAAYLLSWSYRRIGPNPVSRTLVGAILVIALVPATLPFAYRWSEMPTFGHLAGVVSEQAYRTDNEDPDVYLWAPAARWIDRQLSEDDRVLMLFEGRGYYLETPKLQDNLMANWPLVASVREPGDCLGRAGVTHVLVNYGVLSVHMRHGMPLETIAWPSFVNFAEECLTRTGVNSPYALYRVARGGGGSYTPRAVGGRR